MKRFLERMEGEKKSVLPSIREEQIGGVYTLRERGVVKRDADPYIIRVEIKRRKREGTKLRKG